MKAGRRVKSKKNYNALQPIKAGEIKTTKIKRARTYNPAGSEVNKAAYCIVHITARDDIVQLGYAGDLMRVHIAHLYPTTVVSLRVTIKTKIRVKSREGSKESTEMGSMGRRAP